MVYAFTRLRYQVSVYRTIGPLVSFEEKNIPYTDITFFLSFFLPFFLSFFLLYGALLKYIVNEV